MTYFCHADVQAIYDPKAAKLLMGRCTRYLNDVSKRKRTDVPGFIQRKHYTLEELEAHLEWYDNFSTHNKLNEVAAKNAKIEIDARLAAFKAHVKNLEINQDQE